MYLSQKETLMCGESRIVHVHLVIHLYTTFYVAVCAYFPLVDMRMYTASVVHIPLLLLV